MRTRRNGQHSIFALAGWLFADLLLVLTLIFLATAAPWIPNVASQPKAPPVICGLSTTPNVVKITARDPYGLRNQTRSALAGFASDLQLKSKLKSDTGKTAGLVEVFGGSKSVGDGVRFAAGAIASMKTQAHSKFIFSTQTVFFKPLWDGNLNYNQLTIYVFYFIEAQKCAAS